MKFTFAWARVAAQNVTLKVATTILGLITLTQLVGIVSLSLREPLVIERGCKTKVLPLTSSQHNESEIIAFLKEALPMRFDSDLAPRMDLFSAEELSARDKEQGALRDKQMQERFLFNDASVSDKEILVNGDRLVSIGKIKSVLPLALKVAVQQVPRTEANPYGLVLAELHEIERKEK